MTSGVYMIVCLKGGGGGGRCSIIHPTGLIFRFRALELGKVIGLLALDAWAGLHFCSEI